MSVSQMDANTIKRKRKALMDAARAILDKVERQHRSEEEMTRAERRDFDGLLAQATALEPLIESMERTGNHMTTGTSTRQFYSNPQDGGNIGMSPGELGKYSIIRAIRAASSGDWRGAGLELEASDALAQRLGRSPRGPSGFFVPSDVTREQRDLLKGTSGAGGYTVATDMLGASFIDVLRAKSCVMAAGATVLDGLVGDVTISRQSSPATAYWVAENVAPTESQQAFEQVALSARSVAAYTDISRKLLLQSSIDVEMLVRNDLAKVLATEIDRVSLHGSGSGSQPTGIDHTTGIGAPVDYSSIGLAPTLAHIVALETAVSVANADIGKLAYITNSKVRGKLKGTLITTTYGDKMVWGEGGTPLNGYPAFVTNQVSSTLTAGSSNAICSACFFGNWADLIFGMWGSLDVLVDPFTGGNTGAVRVIAFEDLDIGVRHPLSFAALLGVLTT